MIAMALLFILIFVLALIFLMANQGQFVDIDLFGISVVTSVELWVVILIPFIVGAIFTWMFMSFFVIQNRTEIKKLQSKNRQLMKEVENLRNLSLEDIPDEPPVKLPANVISTGVQS